MKKYLELKVDGKKYALRLAAGGQISLVERFDEDAMQTIMSAGTDVKRLTALLEASLNWKGNENPTTDGVEFYDLLVDEGYCGVEAFGKLAVDIAVASGILTEAQAKKTRAYLEKTVAGVFETFDEPEENPTQP